MIFLFLRFQYIKVTKMSYENFCPKRIFRCLCLTHVLNHVISMKNVHTYNDIKKVFTELFGVSGGTIYGIRGQKKANAMTVCSVHMNIIAMKEMKYDCTSVTKK